MILDIIRYVAVAVIIYILGMCGIVLGRKNIIIMLMSIELMLLAVNLNLLIFSVYIDDLIGQFFALLILTVAAAESAIGLAILVIYFRIRGTILVQFIHFVKG
uniref:NADH dehydrogenase subunit 4L n=1 Tax=Marophrys sp. SRT127 TaxID=2488311 RepID=A0A455REP9_9EUKA|nr:NADH dehydrogenase subunit 4L [Marophrys sp. SRT127]